MNQNEKNIDLELFIFYLIVSLGSFFLYMSKHPLVSSFKNYGINFKSVIFAYSFDLIIFLIILVPYIIIIFALIIYKIFYKKKIKDNIIVILFFPILSFFTKGMSLIQIYINYSFKEILKNNFAFFVFLFVGPGIIIIHKLIVYIKRSKIE